MRHARTLGSTRNVPQLNHGSVHTCARPAPCIPHTANLTLPLSAGGVGNDNGGNAGGTRAGGMPSDSTPRYRASRLASFIASISLFHLKKVIYHCILSFC